MNELLIPEVLIANSGPVLHLISNDGNYRAQSCLLPVLPFISLPAFAGVIEPTGLVTNLNLIELEGLMA